MNCVRRIETASDDETRAFGREIGPNLRGVVLLRGDLGTGKTTLAQGIVAGRSAANPDEVSSPTFTLVHEYGNPTSVYHADLYRLDSAEQVLRLGLDEHFETNVLLLIEWGERFPQVWPSDRIEITISHAGGDRRCIEIYE